MKKILLSLLLLMYVSESNAQRIETNFNNDWNFILEDNTSFSKENIDDHALKSLNRAWFKLTSDQKNEEMRSLFNRITSKPRA